jgi:hypothetical protein
MRKLSTICTGILFTLILLSGCARTAREHPIENATTEDSVVWLEEGLGFSGMTIAFGHRNGKLQPGDWLEPTVAITRDGQIVADAMVFYQLATSDGSSTIGDEVATVFESAADGKSAVYAQGKLRLPDEVASVAVRVRIVFLSIDKDWSQDFIVMQASDATASH